MEKIPGLELREQRIQTAYGSVRVYHLEGLSTEAVFLPRHGLSHDTPPHAINYRANLKALECLGVKRVLAVNAVGSISEEISPLDLVLLSDFIDFTSNRESTFFGGGKQGVEHVDMSSPYCPYLRKSLLDLAPKFDLSIHSHGVYVCTNGPRLESPAEIKMFGLLGGDVVGMTGLPEVVLAKELGLCYAAVAFSINWAAGIQESVEFVSDSSGLDRMRRNLIQLLTDTIAATSDAECCL